MTTLLTQATDDRQCETPIALLDLAAYGRSYGRSIDVGYHDGMTTSELANYDRIGFSAIALNNRTWKSLKQLRQKYAGPVRVGGKAMRWIDAAWVERLVGWNIDDIAGAGENWVADNYKDINYDTYPPWSLSDLRRMDASGAATMLMSSRGCPYHCHFCHNTEPKVSYFSPERTAANAALMVNDLGKQRIFFVDDIFALKPEHMMAVLQACDGIGLNLRQRTSFFVHVNQLSQRHLGAIAAWAPAEMQMGVESGDDSMLKAMGKTFTAAEAEDRLRTLHSLGHHTACLFLMGFPGETIDSLQRTVDFALRNRSYMSGWWVSYYQAVPGTVGWERATERLGREPPDGDWNTEITYLDPNLTREDLTSARAAIMGN